MTARTQSTLSAFSKLLAVLVIIGALNWGLIGLFKWNLVTALFGETSACGQCLYILVGLAGLALAFTFPWRNERVGPGTAERSQDSPREVRP
ncbi:DUF378 domain-containing protein [Vitiosangium sp. GDMCC 1.1324]|uniref:DUF378 domain-containing protein n=1 Tax=Vitiosangium sp. (strain GDMCC 1.1324) TaxID=2138576 RepID=UPI000D392F04|nr:DUF378 domain-containing protein [Vitiosangium sp. GDMCC 1.1324]PTL84634.1 DUF378 domain-containing protein [Vitiosangium sp. GDMCC 1.1324]